MPLWFFPALLGLFAIISLISGIWLLLHLPDIARIFRGKQEGELVPGRAKRRASSATVWGMLLLFTAGWLACLTIWVLVIGGDANQVVVSVS